MRVNRSGPGKQAAARARKRRSAEAREATLQSIDTVPRSRVIEDEAAREQMPYERRSLTKQERHQEAIEGLMTPEDVRRAHREDFYGALKKDDLEKLSHIYSDDY